MIYEVAEITQDRIYKEGMQKVQEEIESLFKGWEIIHKPLSIDLYKNKRTWWEILIIKEPDAELYLPYYDSKYDIQVKTLENAKLVDSIFKDRDVMIVKYYKSFDGKDYNY